MTRLRTALRAIARLAARRLRGGAVDRRTAFRDIYARNSWGSNESVSGPGSELGFTSGLQVELAKMLRELGVQSLADAPCGDFNWMRCVDLAGIRYLGVDIVAELIEMNRKQKLFFHRSLRFIWYSCLSFLLHFFSQRRFSQNSCFQLLARQVPMETWLR